MTQKRSSMLDFRDVEFGLCLFYGQFGIYFFSPPKREEESLIGRKKIYKFQIFFLGG